MQGGIEAMADISISQSTPQTPAEPEDILTRIFVEINLLNHQMQKDRTEIDRLKADAARLEEETRSILTRLKARI
jgi:hypothetical protein